jgi:ribosome maturation factor RimP
LFFGEGESVTDSLFLLHKGLCVPFHEATLRQQTAPIVEGLGFRIVEMSMARVTGRTQVSLVIYAESGVGIDDCATVHRTVRPRLEMLMNDRDIALQVMSPGIDRVLKSWSEFEVFVGRGVRILRHGNDEWIRGVIRSATDTEVEVETAEGIVPVRHTDIQKARLDYSQEVR